MFQRIASDKLVLDTKYMIHFRKEGEHSGIYKGPILFGEKTYLVFDKIYDLIEETKVWSPFHLTKHERYYEFITEQPQWKMERRAVNLIVRRLLCDEWFEW